MHWKHFTEHGLGITYIDDFQIKFNMKLDYDNNNKNSLIQFLHLSACQQKVAFNR
jgi:hypothetical protein